MACSSLLSPGSHESLEKHPSRLLPADWLPLCVQGESERMTHGSFEWQKEHALLSSPLATVSGFTGIMKNIPGSKGEGNTGAAWELAALIFNRHLYLKHLLLKQQRHLEAWAMKWCSASSREVSTWLWHCVVSIQGESLQEVKASTMLPMQVKARHLLLLEKLMIKWLVGSYSLVYYIKALAKRRPLRYSQAESPQRGWHKQSSAGLSRDSWPHNNMIVKTLEINSFLSTPEKKFWVFNHRGEIGMVSKQKNNRMK